MSFNIITEKISRLRRSNDYKIWKDKILKRDNYKCVLCGENKNLEIDHIKPLVLYPHLALDINNGRVLCQKCHRKTDTFGSLSKFKGDNPIHPILSGDLLYKLKSLPAMIELNGKELPFKLQYETFSKYWVAGYKFGKIKLIVKGKEIEETIDKLFDSLRNSIDSKIDLLLRKEIKSLDNPNDIHFSWNEELENIIKPKINKQNLPKEFGDRKKIGWIANRIFKHQCLLCNRDYLEDNVKIKRNIYLCDFHNQKIDNKISEFKSD